MQMFQKWLILGKGDINIIFLCLNILKLYFDSIIFLYRVVIASDLCTTIIGSTSQETSSCLSNQSADAHCELKTIEELFFANEVKIFVLLSQIL